MPVIAVINRKGGSGKSTMATHIAAWLAHQGSSVMLGDVDKQQSARTWLKRRPASLPHIVSWAVDQRNVLKVPAGVTHAVLDTPGGMHGLDLARIVMSADVIVMPVCNSLFDRESAASCYAELMTLPRVTSGRCRIGVVGMRLDTSTPHSENSLRAWAKDLGVPFLGGLRQNDLYIKNLDLGQTLFDLSGDAHRFDLAQWESILDWLRPIARPANFQTQDTMATQAPPASIVQRIAVRPSVLVHQPDPQRILSQRTASAPPPIHRTPGFANRLSDFAASRMGIKKPAATAIAPRPSSSISMADRHTPVPQFLLERAGALG